MSTPLLEVGAMNLTQYMDVQPEDGMDTYNPNFSERIFSHSLLKEGGTLALENLQLKELIFPLLLKAASKAALNKLVQELNREITASGIVVAWQDFGAEEPTYFDLSSGQFDIEYDYRKGQNNYVKGKLRLFTQPLGRKATYSLMATSAGTNPLTILTVPTAVAGDADALLYARVTTPSTAFGLYTVMSVLPASSWVVDNMPTAGLLSTVTLEGASGAVGSQYVRVANAKGQVRTPSRSMGIYSSDRIRIFVIARTNTPASTFLYSEVEGAAGGGIFGPTVELTATDWALTDVGVVSFATAVAAFQETVSIQCQGASGGHLDVSRIYLLPDDHSVFIPPPPLGRAVVVDGRARGVFGGSGAGLLNDITPGIRGQIPGLRPSPFTASMPGLVAIVAGPPVGGGAANTFNETVVSVMGRTRWVF